MRQLLLTTLLIASSAAAQTCTNQSTIDPTKPGQITICDAVPPPGPPCQLSLPGSSTVCRINGTAQISENGGNYRPLFTSPPVDVFRFYAPTNLPLTASTSYYIGSLIAGGHSADMVYLVPNDCTLTKVVYDTRSSAAFATPISIVLFDVTQNIPIPNASTTQTWTSWSVETVATPGFALPANDQLQIRLVMPKTLPKNFYVNMTVTAYCTDK